MKKFHAASIILGAVLLGILIWRIGPGDLWRDLSLLGWGLVPFVLIEGGSLSSIPSDGDTASRPITGRSLFFVCSA